MTTNTATLDALRVTMIEKVQKMGWAKRPEVERVLRDTSRHEFVPEAPLEKAYDPYNAVITHRFSDGSSLSCASAPFVVAMMLDQLQVSPGSRVLEIGAGTGYNASLLAELTGPTGRLTTIDIDPDVTAQASHALHAAGYDDVRVVTGDGAAGVPENAPYDRLIATVSPWDIPNAWWDQLAPGARVVAPLRWRGQARSVAFTYTDGRLVADSIELCGFVYLVGEGEGETSAPITNDQTITVHWDRDQAVNPDALRGVFDQPRVTAWSGVTIAGDEPHDGVWLRLTVTDRRVCRINAPGGTPPEVCDPVEACRAPALVDGDSMAYLASRRRETDDGARWELGAYGHGPAATKLTERLCNEVRAWSVERDQRKPNLTVYRAGTPDTDLSGTIIDKTNSRFVLNYDIIGCLPSDELIGEAVKRKHEVGIVAEDASIENPSNDQEL
ncbi:methyltransferase, FxLD system [Phytoactinopolyspora mesophila]|uniref:Protein-L-isoaspartate O-methyltransferase n=1 Tax=Phytoactinopolyspora mesophila TaxID=2650750 RepID=A0A7K3MAK0_9ACTN|nr:methyltransferase, FxLD system [Phytoactinopolyspora mesophila]NDL60210.1 methyltransferase, FxLD system [Phytoactinopolyspora mesophila]